MLNESITIIFEDITGRWYKQIFSGVNDAYNFSKARLEEEASSSSNQYTIKLVAIGPYTLYSVLSERNDVSKLDWMDLVGFFA